MPIITFNKNSKGITREVNGKLYDLANANVWKLNVCSTYNIESLPNGEHTINLPNSVYFALIKEQVYIPQYSIYCNKKDTKELIELPRKSSDLNWILKLCKEFNQEDDDKYENFHYRLSQ